jgi:hypothetical protein
VLSCPFRLAKDCGIGGHMNHFTKFYRASSSTITRLLRKEAASNAKLVLRLRSSAHLGRNLLPQTAIIQTTTIRRHKATSSKVDSFHHIQGLFARGISNSQDLRLSALWVVVRVKLAALPFRFGWSRWRCSLSVFAVWGRCPAHYDIFR